MKHYTYLIINKINSKTYCGVSNNPQKRKNQHFTDLYNNKHKNYKMQSDFNKYGIENFKFLINKEYNTSEEAYKDEYEIVETNKLNIIGYNIANGGKAPNIWKYRDEEYLNEYRNKMSIKITQMIKSGDIKRDSKGSRNSMYGKHHSKETREKLSNILTGSSHKKKNSSNYKRGKNSQAKKLKLTFFNNVNYLVFDCKPDLLDYFKENNIKISCSTVKNLLKQDRYYEYENKKFRIDYY